MSFRLFHNIAYPDTFPIPFSIVRLHFQILSILIHSIQVEAHRRCLDSVLSLEVPGGSTIDPVIQHFHSQRAIRNLN